MKSKIITSEKTNLKKCLQKFIKIKGIPQKGGSFKNVHILVLMKTSCFNATAVHIHCGLDFFLYKADLNVHIFLFASSSITAVGCVSRLISACIMQRLFTNQYCVLASFQLSVWNPALTIFQQYFFFKHCFNISLLPYFSFFPLQFLCLRFLHPHDGVFCRLLPAQCFVVSFGPQKHLYTSVSATFCADSRPQWKFPKICTKNVSFIS